MPNYCDNEVVISGSEEKIKEIKNLISTVNEDRGLFETLIGFDPNISREDYEKGGWYESNIKYWGCKWDVPDDEVDPVFVDNNTIRLFIFTAWSPPIKFCEHLANKFDVDVQITFFEAGVNFSGRYEISNDHIEGYDCDYIEGLYRYDNDIFWHEIYDRIERSIEFSETFEEFISSKNYLDDVEKRELKNIWDDCSIAIKRRVQI